MAKITRRNLIKQTAVGAGAAGVIAAVAVEAPRLLAASATTTAAAQGTAKTTDPIVAAISNPSTGEVSIMIGSREVVFQDHALVSSLLQKAGL